MLMDGTEVAIEVTPLSEGEETEVVMPLLGSAEVPQNPWSSEKAKNEAMLPAMSPTSLPPSFQDGGGGGLMSGGFTPSPPQEGHLGGQRSWRRMQDFTGNGAMKGTCLARGEVKDSFKDLMGQSVAMGGVHGSTKRRRNLRPPW